MSARRSVTLRVSRLGRAKPPPEGERQCRESDAENEPEPWEWIERWLLGGAPRNPGGDREIAGRGGGRGGPGVQAPLLVARDRELGWCRRRRRHDVERRAWRRRRGRWRNVFRIALGRRGRRGRSAPRLIQGGVRRGRGSGRGPGALRARERRHRGRDDEQEDGGRARDC